MEYGNLSTRRIEMSAWHEGGPSKVRELDSSNAMARHQRKHSSFAFQNELNEESLNFQCRVMRKDSKNEKTASQRKPNHEIDVLSNICMSDFALCSSRC
jgi:hypothetical protein